MQYYPEFTADEQRVHVLKLADILEQVPEAAFDMGEYSRTKYPESNECGTVACALGHAAISGEFPGLSAEFHERERFGETIIETVLHVGGVPYPSWYTTGECYFGEDVNERIFHNMFGHDKDEVIEALRNWGRDE